jgi:TRAP-type C4-dicarboxylate transport system substrate-binding protein
MQQKLIDGQESALTTIYESKFYEVQKYITLTNHLYSTDILVANKNFMDNLSPENSTILNECLEIAFSNQYKMYTEKLNTITEELQSKYGVEISEVSKETKEAMVAKMAPVGEKAIVEICGQENLDKIKAFADAARK